MVNGAPFGFNNREWRILQRLTSPNKIQQLLNSLSFHSAQTSWSPRTVLRERAAHCAEGGALAAAALRAIGFPPLLVVLKAVDDEDHVIAVYRRGSAWGALAKSQFNGLRDRAPIHRTLRELVLSYFDDYYNLRGQRTLRAYSRPVNLARFDHLNWTTSERPIWFITDHLLAVPHVRLITNAQVRLLDKLDRHAIRAGLVGHDATEHVARSAVARA